MNFKELLEESKQELIADLQKDWAYVVKTFASERSEVKIPKITLKKTIGKKRSAFGLYDPNSHTIFIDPDVAFNETRRKQTMYHETIHSIDPDWRHPSNRVTAGHGDFFEKIMDRINAKHGSNFVTKEGEITSDLVTQKEFYVYWYEDGNKVKFLWAKKDLPYFRYKIKASAQDRNTYVTKVNMMWFKTGEEITEKKTLKKISIISDTMYIEKLNDGKQLITKEEVLKIYKPEEKHSYIAYSQSTGTMNKYAYMLVNPEEFTKADLPILHRRFGEYAEIKFARFNINVNLGRRYAFPKGELGLMPIGYIERNTTTYEPK